MDRLEVSDHQIGGVMAVQIGQMQLDQIVLALMEALTEIIQPMLAVKTKEFLSPTQINLFLVIWDQREEHQQDLENGQVAIKKDNRQAISFQAIINHLISANLLIQLEFLQMPLELVCKDHLRIPAFMVKINNQYLPRLEILDKIEYLQIERQFQI